MKPFPGHPCESGFVWVDFPPVDPCQGDFECAVWLLSQEERLSLVVHYEEEQFHGHAKSKFFSDISCPLQGHGSMFGTKTN